MADETAHDKLARLGETVGEFYGRSTLIRLGLQVAGVGSALAPAGSTLGIGLAAAPAAAAFLDHMLVVRPARVEQQRGKMLLVGLVHDLERLEREKIDASYFNSTAFGELLEDAIDSAKRTRDRTRIRFNARVLSGAIQLESRRADLGEDPPFFLGLLGGLDPEDVRIIRAFYATERGGPPAGEDPFGWAIENTSKRLLVDHLKEMRRDDFDFRLMRLVGAGLIKTITPRDAVSGGLYAYVLSNVVNRMFNWLERFGGFPTDAEVQRAQTDAEG
jgi:hypothetical protein